MAQAIATLSEVLGKDAKFHRLLEEGGMPPGWVQLVIDDPRARANLIAFGKAGMPEFLLLSDVALDPFEEPKSHAEARKILGQDFLGVTAAERQFGPCTEAQRLERTPLCLFDEDAKALMTEERTLQIVRECRGTHALLCVHPRSSPVQVHARHKEHFSNDKDDPWFGRSGEHNWSKFPIGRPWMLVRKDVVPASWEKTIDNQPGHVLKTFKKERITLPNEHIYGSIFLLKETGQKLCKTHWVRFAVRTAGGCWVRARWNGDQLGVSRWGGSAGGGVGSGSLRRAS